MDKRSAMATPLLVDESPRASALGGSSDHGMDVFVNNFPVNLDKYSLRNFLRSHLSKLSIQSVDYVKAHNKKFACLTFLHTHEAQRFLQHHGQVRVKATGRSIPKDQARYVQLKCNNRDVYFVQSDRPSNPITLRGLQKEQLDRTLNLNRPARPRVSVLPVNFQISSVSCGLYDYTNQSLVFAPQVTWQTEGTARFGTRSMILRFKNDQRIDFRYSAFLSILTESHRTPSLIISMHEAPRFFEKIPENSATQILEMLLGNMGIQDKKGLIPKKASGPERKRLSGLDNDHQKVAGQCLVYRLELQNVIHFGHKGQRQDVRELIEHLKMAPEIPPSIYRPIDVVRPKQMLSEAYKALLAKLSSLSSGLPIRVKFQVQRLAQNNYLHPAIVLQLLPEIEDMQARSCQNTSICVAAIKRLSKQISFSGPDAQADEFVPSELVEFLRKNETELLEGGLPIDALPESNSDNVAIIHRAKITPAGMYLQGAVLETQNRVLRKYPQHHDYFLRVQFGDEDGVSVMFSPRINNYDVYYKRFKDVLDNGIEVAGQQYRFLGFSHSSLRAQSCWFVAPFIFNHILMDNRMIIDDLGDFTVIRTPAKKAARIGQAFSDTSTVIHIDSNMVQNMKDVRNGTRVFSDGVGTVSEPLLMKVWDKLPAAKRTRPTCLQIRYRGAKGMISLDTRLKGEVLMLRDSMIKFEGSTSNDLEICETAYKPLPMYLNRQLIKILEDLGVEDKFFLDLQAKEVEKLRMITTNDINAASFLSRQSIGTVVHLPWLITMLTSMNLNFKDDAFLRDVLEISIVTELRMLKHKTRILVEKGLHLHGLMDETGFLKEGEIFCRRIIDGVPTTLINDEVIISRSPSLHPGDIQLAKAVEPPPGSPLLDLTNCICFSQHGDRDLPSCLAGGDLDGDRYYIMFDENAKLKRTCDAADYPILPPLDIGRPVERSDMTDFFLQFMESDQLGRIAVAHRVLADQNPEGTLHPSCLVLADLHSTAVDFSKTGRPVDTTMIPRMNRFRPDFEAPGPHVRVVKNEVRLLEQEFVDSSDQIDEDDDFSTYQYYESEKILGKLYRAIDERKIFEEIQVRASSDSVNQSSVINAVWDIVQAECSLIEWRHLKEVAWDIRRTYEGCLSNNMIDYSEHPRRPLSEVEAFVGNILGQSKMPSRQERDNAKTMKEKFDEDSLYIVNLIVKDGDAWHKDSLERSMACLAVSLEDSPPGHRDREHLCSFKYVAAAVCLREVELLSLPAMEEDVPLPRIEFD